jgi:hypothetical protein
MPTDFGVPPIATENRVLVEQRLKEVNDGGGVPETLTIEFRGQPRHVEVIDMPVSQLFYNPGTHRIRAQRSYDPSRDLILGKDPWSDESQDYLHYLLTCMPANPSKRDPAFDELMDSLRDHKQIEPGLITREGILVNGNTRRAGLKELGVTSIRVGVLPASCTWADIHAVELSLQLRHDRRREYSYINHLLALDEQMALGRQLSDIARNFHTTTPACQRDVWILSQLRDLIQRSRHGGLSLRLMDFEDAKEKLFELHRAWDKERAKNNDKADALKEVRLAAIVLDYAKTTVRYIQSDFQTRYLDERLPESSKAAASAGPAAVAIPGLNRTIQTAGAQVAAASALTDSLLRAKAVQVAGDKATPAQLASAAEAVNELKESFDEALEYAERAYKTRKKRQAAPDRVTDACRSLEQCITDLVLARGNGSLDEGAFDDALLKLRAVMGRLAVEAGKSIPLPSDGVSWLHDVAASER